MILSVSFGGWPETPLEQIAELLNAVEVRNVEVVAAALTQGGRRPQQGQQWLRDHGVEVIALSTQYPINKGEDAREAQQSLIAAIHLAAELGIGRVNSYSGASDLEDNQQAVARYLERMEPCVRAAEAARVPLMLENQIDVSPGNACARAAHVLRILRHFDSPWLRHTYDPANYYGVGDDPIAAFPDLRPYIAYCHLKDVALATPEMIERHPRFRHWDFPVRPMMAVPAGEGESPLAEAHRLLTESAYEGYASNEPFVELGPLRRSVTHLRRLGVRG